MWRYLSSQVVAVLDVEDSNMDKGHITMTERSVGAFHRLKGEGECEEDKADGEKSQKKKPKKGKGTGFKAAHRWLRGTALRSMKKHQNPGEASDLMETWWFANRDRCL